MGSIFSFQFEQKIVLQKLSGRVVGLFWPADSLLLAYLPFKHPPAVITLWQHVCLFCTSDMQTRISYRFPSTQFTSGHLSQSTPFPEYAHLPPVAQQLSNHPFLSFLKNSKILIRSSTMAFQPPQAPDDVLQKLQGKPSPKEPFNNLLTKPTFPIRSSILHPYLSLQSLHRGPPHRRPHKS